MLHRRLVLACLGVAILISAPVRALDQIAVDASTILNTTSMIRVALAQNGAPTLNVCLPVQGVNAYSPDASSVRPYIEIAASRAVFIERWHCLGPTYSQSGYDNGDSIRLDLVKNPTNAGGGTTISSITLTGSPWTWPVASAAAVNQLVAMNGASDWLGIRVGAVTDTGTAFANSHIICQVYGAF